MSRTTPKRRRALHRATTEALEPRRLLAGGPYHWSLGAEIHVNSYTTFAQVAPSMAMDADGDFVVAWQSDGQDGDGSTGVYAQRYNTAGLPQGAEFRVNTYTTGYQFAPSAAMDTDGDFVIAWSGTGEGDEFGIFAQPYNAAGVKLGTEFRVNTGPTDAQQNPTVAMDADGDFVVAWESGYVGYYTMSSNVRARRYNASGVPQGMEFGVSSDPPSLQFAPSAKMDANGNFVVAWSAPGDGDGSDVFAARYNAAGERQGTWFRVNSYTTRSQQEPDVAMDADGDFFVTWAGWAQDGSSYEIFAQRYNAAGVTQGTEFRVNTYTAPANQFAPSAAMNAAGEFVVTWRSEGQDGSSGGIYAQRYNDSGAALGTEFRVNPVTTGDQWLSSATMDADGDFVVTWTSQEQDGSSHGVFAQRYTTFGPAGAATIGDRVWNDSDANGIQDAGESGIAGASVELYSASGAAIATVSTSATGQYSFPILAGASAFLRFVTPAAFLTTHQNRGSNDALDSDIDRATGLTPIFTAGATGTTNNSLDAGFCLPGSVGGIAFFDRSGDGVRNGGEEALSGFQIFLDFDADGVPDPNEPAATTNFDGSYAFGSLLGDTYRVGVVDQAQWVEPAELPFLVVPGAATPINLSLRTSAPDSISAAQGAAFGVGEQTSSSIAIDADGDFVITWSGVRPGDADGGVYAQRYNAAGVKQGTEFRVNTYTTGVQAGSSAAMDADGDFVVTWTSHGQDGSYGGVYAQRYNAAGVKQGIELRVNTYTPNYQFDPSIAMDNDGDFVVTWNSRYQNGSYNGGIYVKRYSAAGVAQGGEFRVNTSTTFNNVTPSVAMDADGDFVVAWTSGFNGYYYIVPDNIHAQRYNAAGVPQGTEFEVPTFSYLVQQAPSVAMDDDGDFVIAWQSPDGGSWGVKAQQYGAAGVPQGAAFLANTYWTNAQYNPSAAMDASGDFIISWTSIGQDGSDEGIYAQRYNAAGLRQGTEFRVNSYTRWNQSVSSVAVDADGDFVVTWEGFGQTGGNFAVHARRYSVSQRPAITASQFVWQNAPQRIEFTFDQDVSASLTSSDLVLTNLTTGATIPTGSIVKSWNAVTKTATFTFPTLPNGGSLPDGNYRATLPAAGVSNAAGSTLAVDYALDFFFLAGDANRDRLVNLQDFNILAGNFGSTSATFSQADFNYDGNVTLADFNILASRFGTSLDGATTAFTADLKSSGRTARSRELIRMLHDIIA